LSYSQLVFKLLTAACAAYGPFKIAIIFCNDLKYQFSQHFDQIQKDIETCTKNYFSNYCSPLSAQTKFMAPYCIDWEKCKNQNPRHIEKTAIIAESIARVLNTFVKTMSWKTIV
ncbi:Brl1/Brr6 domain-containing protein, partial [Phakopsora pachyrhizi]